MFYNIAYLVRTTYRKHFFSGAVIALAWLLHATSKFVFIILSQKTYDAYRNEGFGRTFISAIVLLVGSLLIDQIAITLGNSLAENNSYLVLRELSDSLQNKVKMQNAICFEKSEYLDALEQAKEGTENGVYLLNVVQMVSFFQIPYLILVSIYLLDKNFFLFFTFIFISIPGCIHQLRKQKYYSELAREIAPLEREYKAYEQVFTGKDSFMETRFWGSGSEIQLKVDNSIKCINERKLNVARKSLQWGIISQMLSAVCYGIALCILAWSSINGILTVGVLVAIFSSFSTVSDLIKSLVCEYWGQIAEQSGNVGHLVNFLKSKSEIEDNVKIGKIDSIEARNIFFNYPSDTRMTLKNISFSSNEKEVIAIVGENGAGKTTLLKVLSGLFPSASGEVLINGEKSDSGRLCNFSFVFQNYQRYALTFSDNICLGQEISDSKFESIVEKVGLSNTYLKNGESTILSKEFGDTELSGGQWQRVAIARGITKESEIFVLDEPTSAIDPIEESKLYDLFLNIGKDKRMFIVTHRMGICRYVNRILVMKNGELVEEGSHEDLMKEKGEYYRLYSSQISLYS